MTEGWLLAFLIVNCAGIWILANIAGHVERLVELWEKWDADRNG